MLACCRAYASSRLQSARSTRIPGTRVRGFYERYLMSKNSNSTSIHRDERTSHREVAQQLVGAPDKIRKKWSVQILRRGSLTGPAFLEFKFPTQGGGLSELTMRNSDLRHNKLLDHFSDYLPIFPANVGTTDPAQCQFIRGLVSSGAELDHAITGYDRVHRYRHVRYT